jgi:hypothetical protein
MRTTTETLQQAIEQEGTYDIIPRLVIKPTRVYFSAFTDNAPAWALGAGLQDEPTPQDVISPTVGNILTVYPSGGQLKYMWSGSATEANLGVSTFDHSKPGLFGDKIFYLDTNVGADNLRRLTWEDDPRDGMTITATELIDTISTSSSIHALSDTEAVVTSVDEGGIRATYYHLQGTWDSYPMPGRFMAPTELITDPYWTNFSAAVKFNGDIYVFASMPDGTVQGCKYDPTIGVWSKVFISVQADLSRFRITNAIVTDGRIHLSGQFTRTDEFDSGAVHNFVLESVTGGIFAIERTSLVARTGHRWLLCQNGNTLYFCDTNRIASVAASTKYTATPTTLSIPGDDILYVSTSDSSSANAGLEVGLKSGDEVYEAHALVKRWNLVDLYIGYRTSVGIEEVLWGSYVIDSISKGRADGERNLSFQAIADSLWRIERIPSPVYAEILGKTIVYDDLDELDNMYVAPNAGLATDMLAVDFWGSEPFSPDGTVTGIDLINSEGSIEPHTSYRDHKVGVQTEDIRKKFSSSAYPFTRGSVRVSIFGWCRTLETGHQNDTVTPVLIIEDSEGDEQNIDTGTLVSESAKWPQIYVDQVGGNEPIEYDFTLSDGDQIKSIGLVFEASNGTVFLPARVELRGVVFNRRGSDENQPWDVVDGGFELPGSARPYVMFSVRPYSTFDFNAQAAFKIDPGRVPNNWNTYFGLVGLASDGANYIAGRYCWQTKTAEIIKVRDNEVTVLAYSRYDILPELDETTLKFTHKDGKFSLFGKISDTWVPAILEYEWQAADGAMCMSEDGIMHVGIYGHISVPYFHILDLDPDRSDGVGIAPVLPTHNLDYFPNAGKIRIGECVYNYNGKSNWQIREPVFSNDSALGPYPGVPDVDGDEEDTPGINMAFFNYVHGEAQQYSADYVSKGHLIAINGSNRILGDGTHFSSRWFEGDRSRWFSNSLGTATFVSGSSKCYIARGLLNLVLADGDERNYSEGDLCALFTTDQIIATSFSGGNLSPIVTVRDMLERVCATVGVQATFPGDRQSTIAASPTGVEV